MFVLCCVTDLPRVKEKRPGLYSNIWCDKCIRSYQVTKDSSRPSHAKVHKIDNVRNKSCKMDFCYVLFI